MYRKRDLTALVKNIDFTLLFSDSVIKVSYKFEMLNFKMALVIKHYVHVALLFVI